MRTLIVAVLLVAACGDGSSSTSPNAWESNCCSVTTKKCDLTHLPDAHDVACMSCECLSCSVAAVKWKGCIQYVNPISYDSGLIRRTGQLCGEERLTVEGKTTTTQHPACPAQ